jgi:hypothetical protein
LFADAIFARSVVFAFFSPHTMNKLGLNDKDSEDLPVPVLGRGDDGPKLDRKRWLGSVDNKTVRGMKSRHLTFIAIGESCRWTRKRNADEGRIAL